MSDIICTRDGYECNGCPIKEKCDDADNHTAINLWEIYQQGRADAIDEILKRIFDDIESHTEKIGERIYKSYPNCQMIVDKLE